MSTLMPATSAFTLAGQLLSFVIRDGYKIKYLRLGVADREYWIKLPKPLRTQLDPQIVPGCWIEVSGTRKFDFKAGKLKLKAESITPIAADGVSQAFLGDLSCPLPAIAAQPSKGSILVCQKSSCWKRGGQVVCQILEQALRDRGLDDCVQVKRTGCLKQCKKGPNVVMLPDKARYSNVDPENVVSLLDRHWDRADGSRIF
jgi:(2Fe-2S) ferredoxin